MRNQGTATKSLDNEDCRKGGFWGSSPAFSDDWGLGCLKTTNWCPNVGGAPGGLGIDAGGVCRAEQGVDVVEASGRHAFASVAARQNAALSPHSVLQQSCSRPTIRLPESTRWPLKPVSFSVLQNRGPDVRATGYVLRFSELSL